VLKVGSEVDAVFKEHLKKALISLDLSIVIMNSKVMVNIEVLYIIFSVIFLAEKKMEKEN
jgi:hypothetical protein